MSDKVEQLTEYYGGDSLAASVLADKYLKEEETTPEQMWTRIAQAATAATAEGFYDEDSERCEKEFYDILKD